MLHFFEEPPISGNKGSGAVFFSGCNLRCVFCQNAAISKNISGKKVEVQELADIFFSLERQGAHNINLVTAAPYIDKVVEAIKIYKRSGKLPIVHNTSGYESVEAIRSLEGLIDVYLPDLKYLDSVAAGKYSCAPDYPEIATAAIKEMYRQQGKVVMQDGLIKKGIIIRHLVLPGLSGDSVNVVRYISDNFPNALVSVMSQFTPEFNDGKYPELNRRITSYEYGKVMREVEKTNLEGFFQAASSADAKYTPDF
jgi:putative pyruvate formate lyase activating enzyme